MKWMIVFALLAAIILPFRGTDIATLDPAEALWLEKENGWVRIETDTGKEGIGKTVREALADMQATAPNTIFLETVDYLIVAQGSEMLLQQIIPILRGSCRVCAASEKPSMKHAAQFFAVHEPKKTLQQWRAEKGALPLLIQEAGRFHWRENENTKCTDECVAVGCIGGAVGEHSRTQPVAHGISNGSRLRHSDIFCPAKPGKNDS